MLFRSMIKKNKINALKNLFKNVSKRRTRFLYTKLSIYTSLHLTVLDHSSKNIPRIILKHAYNFCRNIFS